MKFKRQSQKTEVVTKMSNLHHHSSSTMSLAFSYSSISTTRTTRITSTDPVIAFKRPHDNTRFFRTIITPSISFIPSYFRFNSSFTPSVSISSRSVPLSPCHRLRHQTTITPTPLLLPSHQFPSVFPTHCPNDNNSNLPNKNQRQQTKMVSTDAGVMGGLTEALEFLGATTIIIPIFRRLKLSPILGFLLSGILLGPHGLRLVADVEDVSHLADFGVLFLLFEMGLELSLDRLRRLRKYAFGMGFLQISMSSLILGLGAYAMGGTIQESAVIGTALSLSSSAFILQILAEKGERQSRAGVATFGVLLMQDIAVVPLLLLVPLLGASKLGLEAPRLTWLAPSTLNAVRQGAAHVIATLGTLNFVVLAGGAFLKKVFSFVADSRSSEAFTSAVLLTVLGTSLVTEEIGLSMTMGAFLAGVLLAESSFRSRIKVDLEPFRGLFLGLFFITTGMSLDMSLFVSEPSQLLFLISSLIFVKTMITTIVGLPFGLSLAESLRVGLLLGQGGEFAFVLFALAKQLGYLPESLSEFLTTTVVVTMALTPLLYETGMWIAPRLDKFVSSFGGSAATTTQQATIQEISEDGDNVGFVLICGYGPVGKVVGRMLSRKFIRWIAVDIDRKIVSNAIEQNLPVLYGDSSKVTELLAANNLVPPDAFVITYTDDELVEDTFSSFRSLFPDRSVFLRAKSLKQQKEFLEQGARALYPETFETSLQLGQSVLKGFNTSDVDIGAIKAEVRGDYGLNEVFKEYENWFTGNNNNGDSDNDNDNDKEEDVESHSLSSSNGEVNESEEQVMNDMTKVKAKEGEIGNGTATATTTATTTAETTTTATTVATTGHEQDAQSKIISPTSTSLSPSRDNKNHNNNNLSL